jgi:alpha-D-ribose 1-methylphosphonate 5-triphosphate synthase subunit PhnL
MTLQSTDAMPMLQMRNLSKQFLLHLQNSTALSVLHNFNLTLSQGECVRLSGPSGMGKSTVLKLAFGNYRASSGEILVRDTEGQFIDMTQASARSVLHLRSHSMAYVSQFLRVIPRVAAIDIVAEPLLENGLDLVSREQAREEAANWLSRLRIPESLWQLPPATFSGGEQQRVALARAFVVKPQVLLADEPTGSLDHASGERIMDLMFELNQESGTTLVLVTHDPKLAARCDLYMTIEAGQRV